MMRMLVWGGGVDGNYITGGVRETSDDEGNRWGSGRLVTIWKANAAESEEMKCCGGSWSIQKGLSCMNGDDDEHDQGEQEMLKSTAWEAEREMIVEMMMTAKQRRGSLAKGKENRARREGWASGKEEENGA